MSGIRISRSTKLTGHAYAYTATLNEKTGALRWIEAGCRDWQTFEHAFAHYNGQSTYTDKWSDRRLEEHLTRAFTSARADRLASFQLDVADWRKWMNWRDEARAVLLDLQKAVTTRQLAMRAKAKPKTKPKTKARRKK